MWVTEAANGFGLTVETTRQLCHRVTPYQTIDLYDTRKVGKMLLLDGIIQFTEYDEFAYQEMLAHLPLFAHPAPRRVLVIGGGDGGVLREIAKHPEPEEIDICEIDREVIEAVREFVPSMACGFDDPRVTVHIGDGSEFVRTREGRYDVIIVDSTDPGGPGEALFNETFYAGMKRALTPGGVIASQAESIYLLPEIVKRLCVITNHLFRYCGYASILVPTYPTGTIGARLASDGRDVTTPAREPSPEVAAKLRYYTPAIHRAAFTVPKFAEELISAR